ncbi:hypothetical protein CHLRE_01g002227v5 [Chlamydomonas reinhardtii]|uniref:Uncharacterized protein n=1 Tax=Chlamydomonas reinhardtii TaxID=3055 RepID=A0A2K3E4S6_CHLRE|nr:uncharacterized protein CHLRE_01g002227v5 [Chlamydomonas reinhardtii]PNW87790.1 hypothetical protein CHLRE_01g002227v5 [Chlamydomonas reinhardtii]
MSTAALPLAVEAVLTNASSSSHVIARAGICEPATDEKTTLAPARPGPAPTPSPAVAAAVARVLQASCRLGSLGGIGSSRGPCHGAGGAHKPTGLLVGGDVSTAVVQGAGSGKVATGRAAAGQWQPHELEVLLAAAQRLNTAARGAGNRTSRGAVRKLSLPAPRGELAKMMVQLGWDPTDARERMRLRTRLSQMRARLDHEESPEEVMGTTKCARPRNASMRWTAWCRDAFLTLPGYQGTFDDVCAVLLANPNIAPLLDHR